MQFSQEDIAKKQPSSRINHIVCFGTKGNGSEDLVKARELSFPAVVSEVFPEWHRDKQRRIVNLFLSLFFRFLFKLRARGCEAELVQCTCWDGTGERVPL